MLCTAISLKPFRSCAFLRKRRVASEFAGKLSAIGLQSSVYLLFFGTEKQVNIDKYVVTHSLVRELVVNLFISITE